MTVDGDKELPKEWGAYLIDEVVSTAGPTVTYRARRTRGGPRYERHVLLKTLRSSAAATRQQLQVLQREAEACSRVKSPLFATLLDTARNGDGFALIFADDNGFRLPRLLERNNKLQPRHALAIGLELARALSHLHRHGHLHGNLRPEVIELGTDGSLRLHDGFCSLSAQGTEDLTSPALLSPEQVLGHDGDARSDVFLLGSLLYRILTGRNAFQATTGGIGQSVRHTSPPAPHELIPQLDRSLSQTIMRCLAKRPAERFADMTSLSCQLARLLRRETSLPIDHMLVGALADANLVDPLPLPKERDLQLGLGPKKRNMRFWIGGLATLGLLGTVLLFGLRSSSNPPVATPGNPRGVWRQPAQLRVVAHPWAEIHIDGEHRATTPIAFPIELRPGRHQIVLKHPFATSESREIQIIAGQIIALDVQMKVVRPAKPKEVPPAQAREDGSP